MPHSYRGFDIHQLDSIANQAAIAEGVQMSRIVGEACGNARERCARVLHNFSILHHQLSIKSSTPQLRCYGRLHKSQTLSVQGICIKSCWTRLAHHGACHHCQVSPPKTCTNTRQNSFIAPYVQNTPRKG